MKYQNPWLKKSLKTITPVKHLLSNLSVQVRTHQYNLFWSLLKPNSHSKVLDVGVTSDETLKDSNMFEKLYQYPKKLTAATIENKGKLSKLYPGIKVVQILPGKKLPFKNKEFDMVVSWATVEHVGDYKEQEKFINELMRVGKKVFLTTPYRGCIYEPHTGFFLLHWLPLEWFRKVCRITNRKFWGTSSNLNPLWVKDIKGMKLSKKVKINIYSTFNIIPSHIIISA